MNTQGMLPLEEEVADYIKETNHHVLYRVTPIFMGDELIARGVLMEAKSIESDAIEFCVFAYNVQPGVTIDYSTGDNHLDESFFEGDEQNDYVLNTNTFKFHLPDCENIQDINDENREEYHGSRRVLIAQGYSPCGGCNP